MSKEVMQQARNALVWNLNTDLDNIPACEKWANMLRNNIDALDKAIADDELKWVGLTKQQRNNIEDICEMIIGQPAFDAIEAQLKENNAYKENE